MPEVRDLSEALPETSMDPITGVGVVASRNRAPTGYDVVSLDPASSLLFTDSADCRLLCSGPSEPVCEMCFFPPGPSAGRAQRQGAGGACPGLGVRSLYLSGGPWPRPRPLGCSSSPSVRPAGWLH